MGKGKGKGKLFVVIYRMRWYFIEKRSDLWK